MRMHLVVVGEPDRQLLKNGQCVRRWVDVHVVTLEGFDEGFRHTVALRRAIRGATRRQTDVLRKASRLPSNVARAVVAQPFSRTRQTGNPPKRLLIVSTITSRTSSPLMPAVVAAELVLAMKEQALAKTALPETR